VHFELVKTTNKQITAHIAKPLEQPSCSKETEFSGLLDLQLLGFGVQLQLQPELESLNGMAGELLGEPEHIT